MLRLPRWAALLLTAVLLTATLMLALAGCSLAGSNLRAGGSQRVSQLVLTTLQDPKTFNYALNQEFPSIFLFCFRGLTQQKGTTGEIQPDLAESWEISPDQTQITFTLRPDLKWSDGAPLTADDVVFTYEDVIFNPKVPAESQEVLRLGKDRQLPQVIKLDERRVQFVLAEPFAPFLSATSGPPTDIVILPKHKLEQSVQQLDANGNPLFLSTWGSDTDPVEIVVNGPYLIEQYRPSERLIFRRNPNYWNSEAAAQPVERIIWQIAESTDSQLLSFRSGDLDAIGDVRPLRPEYFELLKREEERGKFKVYNGGTWSGNTFITFNLNQAQNAQGQPFVDPIKSRWFNSLAFRQAVAHAIDRRRMINNIYRGISVPQDSPLSLQSPYALKPEQGLPVYDYSLDKARALLQSAGFQYSAAGKLLDADGNRVEFTLITNAGNRIREALGSQIREDLAKIGMEVTFNPINFNTLIGKISDTRDWDCVLIGFTGGVEPHAGANLWLSSGSSHMFNLSPQPGQTEITGWAASDWEQEIDQVFQAGARQFDLAQRKPFYDRFQVLVQEQLPVIHLVQEIALMAVRNRVKGVQYNGLPSWGLWNVQELQVENP
ncbi:MAG: ABC transporter substrate-binding protein [Pegethrix bostrychoides GSE-TBD4-15B]|jgi:peptide/nickel transport system substrate-binding protein|uniref:ABC transporter substrate-binding protein n=1 Tax=Pegethrix bostrychoides GSE-TBD4-15B TaxID=2839662 RepID=A0A951U5F7_9CYAN|nr:ABC transporter substrate-binding protein [Pegethrix bostrychoides GSE-TBD4-15B]